MIAHYHPKRTSGSTIYVAGNTDLLLSASTSYLNAAMFDITTGVYLPTLIRYNKTSLVATLLEFGKSFSGGTDPSIGLSCSGIYCFVAYSIEDELILSKVSEVDNSISTKQYDGHSSRDLSFQRLLVNSDSIFIVSTRIKVGDTDSSSSK